MHLTRVTITGADGSINPDDLFPIAQQYPFVEWGILLSQNSEGAPRFPSFEWQKRLAMLNSESRLTLSGHLCGRWVRDLVDGVSTYFEARAGVSTMFDRFQLNFHASRHHISLTGVEALRQHLRSRQVILQYDGENNGHAERLRLQGIDAVPLFDLSGGAGVLPGSWPAAIPPYSGYAGGLSPDNLEEQLQFIDQVCGDVPIWIDVETHVRSNFDQLFDLEKVKRFLSIAARWVDTTA